MNHAVRGAPNRMLKDYPNLLNIDEMCAALGICTKKRDGSIVSRKAGRKYCIPKAYLKMNSAVTKWKRHPKGVAFGFLRLF